MYLYYSAYKNILKLIRSLIKEIFNAYLNIGYSIVEHNLILSIVVECNNF